MIYLIYALYILAFIYTSFFLDSTKRFLLQVLILSFLVTLESYYFYLDVFLYASSEGLSWFAPGFRRETSADISRYGFENHLFGHHLIYSFIVFMILLNVFHFGSRAVDFYTKRSLNT